MSELDRLTEAAIARLEAQIDHRLTCPRCGHEDDVRDDPEKSIYTCDDCGCRIAFGNEQPSIAITPHEDRRFICSTFATGAGDLKNDVTITLDREYATQLAFEILSVCAPGKWKALMEQVQRAHDVPGAPARQEDEGTTLDAPLATP